MRYENNKSVEYLTGAVAAAATKKPVWEKPVLGEFGVSMATQFAGVHADDGIFGATS